MTKRIVVSLVSMALSIPFFFIVYLNLTPGHYRQDACGCSVRYADSKFADPVNLTSDNGMLICVRENCPKGFADTVKLLTSYVDFNK